MSVRIHPAYPALLGIFLFTLSGCGGGPAPASTVTSQAGHDHEHAHADHGPHGGDLIELGSDEYHAEVVHQDGGKLGVYILDGAAAVAVPIDAGEITLNVVVDGQPAQYPLTASPTETDAAGKASLFVSADGQAHNALHREGATAKLVLTINGRSYQGAVMHSHSHEHGTCSHGSCCHKHGGCGNDKCTCGKECTCEAGQCQCEPGKCQCPDHTH
ncbi:MAG: hypothetical protein JNG89_17595 [Planctomycetaceae bacterium]|nr:hypothetical protein [Planctomycetaceae bacterium]